MQYIFTFLNTYIKGVLVNMLMFKLFFNADFQVVVLTCLSSLLFPRFSLR